MAPITPISLANPAATIQPASISGPSKDDAGSTFQGMFKSAVNTVEGFQNEANVAVQRLLSGEDEDVHTPIIASQRADLSFQLFMEVRNKVMSAYQSLIGMQL
jgi:flagellar hook-basal body complex protein FliE